MSNPLGSTQPPEVITVDAGLVSSPALILLGIALMNLNRRITMPGIDDAERERIASGIARLLPGGRSGLYTEYHKRREKAGSKSEN